MGEEEVADMCYALLSVKSLRALRLEGNDVRLDATLALLTLARRHTSLLTIDFTSQDLRENAWDSRQMKLMVELQQLLARRGQYDASLSRSPFIFDLEWATPSATPSALPQVPEAMVKSAEQVVTPSANPDGTDGTLKESSSKRDKGEKDKAKKKLVASTEVKRISILGVSGSGRVAASRDDAPVRDTEKKEDKKDETKKEEPKKEQAASSAPVPTGERRQSAQWGAIKPGAAPRKSVLVTGQARRGPAEGNDGSTSPKDSEPTVLSMQAGMTRKASFAKKSTPLVPGKEESVESESSSVVEASSEESS